MAVKMSNVLDNLPSTWRPYRSGGQQRWDRAIRGCLLVVSTPYTGRWYANHEWRVVCAGRTKAEGFGSTAREAAAEAMRAVRVKGR